MTDRLTSAVFLFAFTFLVWGAALVTGNLTTLPEPREESSDRSSSLSEDAQALLKEAQEHPQDTAKQLEAAEALANEAKRSGSSQMMLAALSRYTQAVKLDPNNEDAILALATLSLESGVLDQAKIYYEKYLALNSKDTRARNDYALVLIQTGEPAKAVEMLKSVVEKDPTLFPSRLTLALAYQSAGNLDEAKKEALRAQEIAPDGQGKRLIADLLAKLNNPSAKPSMPEMMVEEAAQVETEQPRDISPASRINDYFRKNPILGPKIARISWPSSNEAKIELKDFPADRMPPVAKEALVRKMIEKLKGLPEVFKIRLVQLDNQAEIASFEVGTAATEQK